MISLCVMTDFDLSKEYCQLAILDAGGLEVCGSTQLQLRKIVQRTNSMLAPEVLANLLETDDNNCKTGALRILRKVTIHPAIR